MSHNKELIRRTARYNGRQYEATAKTEREALTLLAEKLAAAKRGEEAIGGHMTVDTWFRKWKALYKDPRGLTAKSLGMYDEKYNSYIHPRVGHMKLLDVRDYHLQGVLNEQAGKSRSHVEKLRRVMREMFHRAYRSRMIPYDPAEDLELPNCTEQSRRSITDAERKVILAVAEDHPAGLWVLTMLYTGMRPGEIAALSCADVDLAGNEIHVHAAVESGSARVKAPKTEAGIRDIPIHAALLPRLRAAVEGRPPFEPVFVTSAGNRLNTGAQSRLWKSFRRAMALHMGAQLYRNKLVSDPVAADLCPYCLRHTFCTDLERAGVPLNVAKVLMGHSDIQVTANIYTHKDSATLHANIALLDGSAQRQGPSAGISAGTPNG